MSLKFNRIETESYFLKNSLSFLWFQLHLGDVRDEDEEEDIDEEEEGEGDEEEELEEEEPEEISRIKQEELLEQQQQHHHLLQDRASAATCGKGKGQTTAKRGKEWRSFARNYANNTRSFFKFRSKKN